jgi:hypothetical protein
MAHISTCLLTALHSYRTSGRKFKAMSKLLMSQKHKYQDLARSTRSTGSVKPARFWCIACDRPRSFTYHLRHPPKKPCPPPGVCRKCIKREQLKEHPYLPLAIMFYKVHHYYYTCAYINEQPCASTPVELPLRPAYPEYAELLAEECKDRPLSSHQLLERAPSPVKFEIKPFY